MIVPVILSGGSGTRLWPASRELYPKQMLPLVNEGTMFQNTVTRLSGLADLAAPIIVCNENHRFMVAEQLRSIGEKPLAILLEPVGRNTAPAVAVSAIQGMVGDQDPILLVLPADHVMSDAKALCEAFEQGACLAAEGKLITFGVVPAGPETGYGYIKAGTPLGTTHSANEVAERDAPSAFHVAAFVEKPDQETAKAYLSAGSYFWNSGMFMFKASRYLEELDRFAPEMVGACKKSMAHAQKDLDFTRLDTESFSACPRDSIDYAVMEKTSEAVVIPLDAGWSDVGSWSALWTIGDKTMDGNVLKGDVVTHDTHNCYLHSTHRLVATVGLQDHVVVETEDAVMVSHKNCVQNVKEIVAALKEKGRDEAVSHRKVFRPWGYYDCVDFSDRFQVKRIVVNPGGILSTQMHHHRAEHWVVVKGTAKILHGEETMVLTENQSTYIPLGVVHRLENPGKIPLELIEVQSGSYLGEDDIVRFDDVYGRT